MLYPFNHRAQTKLLSLLYKDKLNKETFWGMAAKIISIISGIFFIIFIPHKAGIAVFGSFSLILAYIDLAGIFFGSSVNYAVKKELVEGKLDQHSKGYFLEGIRIRLILSLISGLLFFVLLTIWPLSILKDHFWYFIIYVIVLNLWSTMITAFESVHRLVFETLLYLVEYSIKIFGMIVWSIYSELTLKSLLIIFISGLAAASIMGFTILFKFFFRVTLKDLFIIDPARVWIIAKRAFFLGLSSLSNLVLSHIDTIMISYYLTIEAVGYYSIASTLAKKAVIVSLPIIIGVIPMLINRQHFDVLLKKTLIRLLMINVPICLVMIFTARHLILIIYGNSYQASIPILQVLSFFPLLCGFLMLFKNILILGDKTNEIFLFGIVAILTNIFLNRVFIPLFNITGAAVATLLCYALWAGMLFFRMKKLNHEVRYSV